MNRIILLSFLSLVSCNTEGELLISQDTWSYSESDYYVDQKIEDSLVYHLSRRYFVNNYPVINEQFDSAVSVLICKSLNDSLIVSRLDYDFQDAGYLSASDTFAHQWSATFTTPKEYFIWQISNPKILTIERREKNGAKVVIDFKCALKPEYDKYLK